jgi:Uma2 family endonuclease
VSTMASTAPRYPVTLDEFLEWEERQPERWEFLDGVVRLMTGGTEDHDRLSINLIRLLASALRGGPCSVHGSNLKVLSRGGNASMYPELFVRCGPREGRRTRIEDPVVVVEVLSPSTAKDDLTRKRRAYKAIPGLKVIVYVSQDEPRLDLVRRREDGGWDEDEAVEGLDAVLELPEIDLRLPMAEIYEDTLVARAAG